MAVRLRRGGLDLASKREIERAWKRAETVPGFDPRRFRASDDDFRAMIRRDCLNHRRPFGWTVRAGRAICFGDLSALARLARLPGRAAEARALH